MYGAPSATPIIAAPQPRIASQPTAVEAHARTTPRRLFLRPTNATATRRAGFAAMTSRDSMDISVSLRRRDRQRIHASDSDSPPPIRAAATLAIGFHRVHRLSG